MACIMATMSQSSFARKQGHVLIRRGSGCRSSRTLLRALPDSGAYPKVEPPRVNDAYVNPARNVQQGVQPAPLRRDEPTALRIGNAAVFGVAAFFAVTAVVTGINYVKKYNSDESKKRRLVLNNAALIRTLAEYLPDNRDGLSPVTLWKLRVLTGFSFPDMFRKFLWYVLRERKFDDVAVTDLKTLRDRMRLNNDELAEAMYERCVRTERTYGNLMLQTEGLTQKAVQKKATGRALFSKLLYLVEHEDFLKPNSTLNVDVLRNIFGATENDIADLRILSLHEVDIDKLDEMARGED